MHNQSQVGGTHYQSFAIQPIDFIRANKLDFCTGSIIKYILRHKNKNGLEDLKKARHYIDLLIEQEYPDPYAEVKKAHENGEAIEILFNINVGEWEVRPNPDWTLPPERYRVKTKA